MVAPKERQVLAVPAVLAEVAAEAAIAVLREQRVPTAEQLVRVLVVPAATVPAAPEEQIPAAAAADRVFQ